MEFADLMAKIATDAVGVAALLVAGRFVFTRVFHQQAEQRKQDHEILMRIIDGNAKVVDAFQAESDANRKAAASEADTERKSHASEVREIAHAAREGDRELAAELKRQTVELAKQTHELRELRRIESGDLPRGQNEDR